MLPARMGQRVCLEDGGSGIRRLKQYVTISAGDEKRFWVLPGWGWRYAWNWFASLVHTWIVRMNDFDQIPLFGLRPEESVLTAIEGFSYHTDFITPEVEHALIQHIDLQPWDNAWKRRVQQYGSSYGKSRPSQAPIPHWLLPLCERFTQEGLFGETPNQIIVNEYIPGQGIAPHSDYLTTGNIVASLSLAAPIVMDFLSPGEKKLSHLLEPRSLFILSGSARYDWKHGIAPRIADKHNGVVMRRKRRISCTFRNAANNP